MFESVDKLTQTLENTKIDSNFEKWNELPPILKLECIKAMDFKMRFGLRSTSRTEKALVDSVRYKFKEITASRGYLFLSNLNAGENYTVNLKKSSENFIPSLLYLLNYCEFDYFQKHFSSVLDDVDLDKIIDDNSIQIRDLTANNKFQSTLKFLKKFWTQTRNIEIFCSYSEPMEQLFTIPAILHVDQLTIASSPWLELKPLIELWMNNVIKMGAKLVFRHVTVFHDLFEDRAVHFDNTVVRMRTDNPERHVLMYYDTKCMELEITLFLVIIPSNLQKYQYSEYMDEVN